MPRFWQQISDAEVARRAQERRRHAEQARGTLDETSFLPLFEVVYLNPCDWRSRLRTVVQAPDADAALAAFLRGEPAISRREILAVDDVSLPAWERNCAFAKGGRQTVAPSTADPELADSMSVN